MNMVGAVLRFKDENKAREEIEKELKDGEAILEIGKAVRKTWGTKYYTGLTDERMIIANCHEDALSRYKSIPVSELDDYLKKKRIELLPFDAPFLTRKRELAKLEKLKGMLSERLGLGEKLISIARANEGILFPYCLGFTDQRILVLRITRFELKNKGFEAIPFSELKAVRYGRYGQEALDVLIDIPFEDSFIKIALVFREGTTFREGKTQTFKLTGINGFRKQRFQ